MQNLSTEIKAIDNQIPEIHTPELLFSSQKQVHHNGRIQHEIPSQTSFDITTQVQLEQQTSSGQPRIPKDGGQRCSGKSLQYKYSRFLQQTFLVPPKTGDQRQVIDLKHPNTILFTKWFKMETAQTIIRSLNQGMWVFSIDQGCLFPHSNPSIFWKIPKNLHGKRSVLVQSTSTQNLISPMALHQDFQTTSNYSQKEIYCLINWDKSELTPTQ